MTSHRVDLSSNIGLFSECVTALSAIEINKDLESSLKTLNATLRVARNGCDVQRNTETEELLYSIEEYLRLLNAAKVADI